MAWSWQKRMLVSSYFYNFVFLFLFLLWMLDVFTFFNFYGFLFIWPFEWDETERHSFSKLESPVNSYCLLCACIGLMLHFGWPRLFVTHFDFIVAVYIANVRYTMCDTPILYSLFLSSCFHFWWHILNGFTELKLLCQFV